MNSSTMAASEGICHGMGARRPAGRAKGVMPSDEIHSTGNSHHQVGRRWGPKGGVTMAITGSTDRADTGAAPPTRRTFTRGAAWSIPVIATATAAPAYAVSPCATHGTATATAPGIPVIVTVPTQCLISYTIIAGSGGRSGGGGAINQRKLLDLVRPKESQCLFTGDANGCSHQWHARHDFTD